MALSTTQVINDNNFDSIFQSQSPIKIQEISNLKSDSFKISQNRNHSTLSSLSSSSPPFPPPQISLQDNFFTNHRNSHDQVNDSSSPDLNYNSKSRSIVDHPSSPLPPSSPILLYAPSSSGRALADVDTSFGSSLSLAESPAISSVHSSANKFSIGKSIYKSGSSPFKVLADQNSIKQTPNKLLYQSYCESPLSRSSAIAIHNCPSVSLTPPQPSIEGDLSISETDTQCEDYFNLSVKPFPLTMDISPSSRVAKDSSHTLPNIHTKSANWPSIPFEWKSQSHSSASTDFTAPSKSVRTSSCSTSHASQPFKAGHKKRPSDCTTQQMMRKKPSRSILERKSSMLIDDTFCPSILNHEKLLNQSTPMTLDSPSNQIKNSLSASPIIGTVGLADFFESSGSPIPSDSQQSILFQSPISVQEQNDIDSLDNLTGSPTYIKTSKHSRTFEKSFSSHLGSNIRAGKLPPAINTNHLYAHGPSTAEGTTFKRPLLPAVTNFPKSAFPILILDGSAKTPENEINSFAISNKPTSSAMRRYHSVCDQSFPSKTHTNVIESDEPQTHVDADSIYAKRHALKTSERADGTSAFKPNHPFTYMPTGSQHANGTHSIDLRNQIANGPTTPKSSLPGHGANEQEGKLLPCHKVKEDGLMRISALTLSQLLNNKLPEATRANIGSIYIIDCRQKYEYDGGHIKDSINLSTPSTATDFIFNGKLNLPVPSTSNEDKKPKEGRTIIIVHCEFSLKRGPGIAKHIRSFDRAKNEYPKLHFPEIYILEGGYYSLFKNFPDCCDPKSYTPMNEEDLDKLLAKPSRHFRRAASWGGAASMNPTSNTCAALTQAVFGSNNFQRPNLKSSATHNTVTKSFTLDKENIKPKTSVGEFTFPSIPKACKIISEEESGTESASGPESPMLFKNTVGNDSSILARKAMHSRVAAVRQPFSRVQSFSAAQNTVSLLHCD